ncbi:glutathione S-transferase family protein [Altericroceibacterium endophyticum]|uniref:Glutathione S-transferase family protein n=1 Tax=Altericroceibacterium endophyticum TaxID=1808508 RepID=A0A6I4T0I9_9SPHN|nr:glutathione S-transferase family protein [Altericroceibacterium endophyticum]MXO64448.1 glutathione S-transferase family protein [Altericroceibacterium endophyticum]
MLKLYSFGPGANSLKPTLALYEKELEFEHKLLNPAKFEHHSEWFKKINPRGQVPALEDRGNIITESTLICEYLEDEHPTDVKLRPDNSFDTAQMRVWTKWVDEYFCWCVSTIGWHRMVGNMVKGLSDAEFEEKLKDIPVHEQRVKWRRAREGFPQEMLDEEMRKIGVSVRRLDDHLADNEWLAGGMYTLADICNFAIANGMQHGFSEMVNGTDTPHLLRWIEQINERPAVKKMFASVPNELKKD